MQDSEIILDHSQLLLNLKKSIELWFLSKRDEELSSDSLEQIQSAIKSILLDGLKPENSTNSYQLFVSDLNWLHISSSSVNKKTAIINTKSELFKLNNDFLSLWIYTSIHLHNLCSSLELLIADKELLENYYETYAFLRNDKYSTAMFICIKSVELKQSSLLSQIDTRLYQFVIPVSAVIIHKHKRSSSHPHFSISPRNTGLLIEKTNEKQLLDQLTTNPTIIPKCLQMSESINIAKITKINLFNRKWKSLPNIRQNLLNNNSRPRSKTFSQPITIPTTRNQFEILPKILDSPVNSIDSEKSCLSDMTSTKYFSNTVPATSNYGNNSIAGSSKTPDLKNQKNIINCNDIKIHLDCNYENSNSTFNSTPKLSNISINYDDMTIAQQPSPLKGISPINFLTCLMSPQSSAQNSLTTTTLWPTKDDSGSSNCGSSSVFSTSVPTDVFGSFLTRDGEKLMKPNNKNLFDDIILQQNTNNINPNSSSSTSLALKNGANGQSLTSLLQSNLFSRNNTDLERENAHFKISEAIISVIEHIKWTKTELAEKEQEQFKQNYKINNKKDKSKNLKDKKINNIVNISEGEAIETATSYLDNSKDTDSIYYAESASEGEYNDIIENVNIEDKIVDDDDHVAYAEWGANNHNALSAEGVGLSLISKFSDRQLPKVSELKWLVSEEDAPQKLLPIPDFSSENPDDHIIHSLTRGTRDWAPPRQQIIFTDHPQISRKTQMQKQKYRCAGCGMRVAPIYVCRFRYCTYLGKYHCTGCHRNHISAIPAKVLSRWDFTLYPVSVFSYRLLEQIWTYPLFNVSDLSPTLYHRVKSLNITKYRRIQLKFLKDFITTCRFANNELNLFNEIPTYLIIEPDIWSMSDFMDTKNGKLIKLLDNLIETCEKHVLACVLCTARGFLCELCRQDQIIYPWQTKVKRCDKCGTCFHKNCCKNIDCVKCKRLIKRQQKINEELFSSIINT